MAARRPVVFLIDLLMIVVLCALILAGVSWVWMIVNKIFDIYPIGDMKTPGYIGSYYLILQVAFIAWFIAWKKIRRGRNPSECVECGRKFVPPNELTGPAVCPKCRENSLGPDELRKEKAKGVRVILGFLFFFTIMMGIGLSDYATRFGRAAWIVLPLLAVGATIGSLAISLFIYIIIQVLYALIRNRKILDPENAVALARKVSGEEGVISTVGPIHLWYEGPLDPSPMLLEQIEVARRRFAALVGEEVEIRDPISTFYFTRRNAFLAFQAKTPTDHWNSVGFYIPAPFRRVSLSTEIVPYRLSHPEWNSRFLFTCALLDSYKGFRISPWILTGISQAVTANGEGLDRLNRKMLASIDKRTNYGEEMFGMKTGKLFKQASAPQDHQNHVRISQFIDQSRSLIEFLCGEDATEDRRGRFHAYLKAIRKGDPDGSLIRNHFGHGYDDLLEEWRRRVNERGVGAHRPPSPSIRDALLNQLIPLILDKNRKPIDRILAVRELGSLGYIVGADSLIQLLQEGSELQREAVWSLESISGMTLGDDHHRWMNWWESLPQDVRQETPGSDRDRDRGGQDARRLGPPGSGHEARDHDDAKDTSGHEARVAPP